MVGDFYNNDGIGVGNRLLLSSLKGYPIKISIKKNRISRIWEMLKYSLQYDVMLLCSPSKLNIIAIKWAMFIKKSVFYRAHGFITEDKNSLVPQKEILAWERFCFEKCDKTFWVSKAAMNCVSKYSDKYVDKFDFVYNAIDFKDIDNILSRLDVVRDHNIIVSVGGGRKQKNNQIIAKTIDRLNLNGYSFRYIVMGKEDDGIDELKKYKCVKFLGEVSREEVFMYMKQAAIFIINSTFDTFSISVVEALMSGCALLIAKNVGAIEVFSTIRKNDIIYDNMDVDEIEKKIIALHKEPNNDRLKKGFLFDLVDSNHSGITLYKKICEEYSKKWDSI